MTMENYPQPGTHAGKDVPVVHRHVMAGATHSVRPYANAPWKKMVLGGIALLAVGGLIYFIALKPGAVVHSADGSSNPTSSRALPVNTVKPIKKTLRKTLEQPGSIRPRAQAELYAKSSGYLKTIQREPKSGAQLDIGSKVRAGLMLLEIFNPEREQGVVEKETIVQQRKAELDAAKVALETYDALIVANKAQVTQAQADVRRFQSEYAFRQKELARLKDLVQSRTVPQEIADEKQHQANAAQAGWESSQAKVLTSQAELTVISSKFTTARAELKVKEALLQVAKDDVALAKLLADYNKVYAPFDGFITYRGVDEGDFIQNASSGQSRHLMTVTALDQVKVVLQVPDRDAPWIQVGTTASFRVESRSALPERKGVISRMAHALDPQTRTMQVEMDLDNKDLQLFPGMYGKVVLTLQEIVDARAIPATAVYSRKGENFIIQVQDGIARRQKVRIRYDDGKEVEVVRLSEGKEAPLDGSEELVVSNKGEIADGQKVVPSLITSFLHGPETGKPGRIAHDGKESLILAALDSDLAARDFGRTGRHLGLPSFPVPGQAASSAPSRGLPGAVVPGL